MSQCLCPILRKGPYNNDRPNMGIGGMTPAQKLNAAA
jgi:hypothetical protein